MPKIETNETVDAVVRKNPRDNSNIVEENSRNNSTLIEENSRDNSTIRQYRTAKKTNSAGDIVFNQLTE